MKKILNGPTVWRAKCPYCDCEFEYDTSETFGVYNKSGDYFRIVQCPNCNRNLHHKENPKSPTEVKKEDTMTT